MMERNKQIQVQMAYELHKYAKLSAKDLYTLLPDLTKDDIIDIFIDENENIYKYINKDVALARYKSEYARESNSLNGVQIKYIYILSNISKFSSYVLARMFGVCQKSIVRIKNRDIHCPVCDKVQLNDYKFLRSVGHIKPRIVLTDEQKKKILGLADQINKGILTMKEIADLCDIHTDTLCNLFKRNNIEVRGKYRSTKLCDNTILDIFDECTNEPEHNRFEDIAKKYHINVKTVSNIRNLKTHKKVLIENRMNKVVELGLI